MKYNTKQRQIVLGLIKEFDGEHVTAEALLSIINERKLDISRATLYRVLDLLVEEGLLKKIIVDNKTSACFQLCDHLDHHHFHLICEKCGKLIHLDCEEVDELIEHISKEHDFDVNASRVVLYGICHDCKKSC